MGIMLYRPGTTHIEHGVQCEMQKFGASDYPAILEQGWFVDPREMGEPVETEKEEPAAVTDEDIRARAKALGIRNWHNKKIPTLLTEMKAKE